MKDLIAEIEKLKDEATNTHRIFGIEACLGIINKHMKGNVLVPIEPSEEMIIAANEAENKAIARFTKGGNTAPFSRQTHYSLIYKAMIATQEEDK